MKKNELLSRNVDTYVDDNAKLLGGNFSIDAQIPTAGGLFQFFSPTKIVVGVGAAELVGKEAQALGGKKALIVTDAGIIKAGLFDKIHHSLTSAKIHVELFDKVVLEPPVRVIDACAQFAREKNIDVIIGLGGGSSLDTAKGASIMAPNSGTVLDYAGMDLVPKRGLPKIMLPTTASGSEVTRVFAPTDEENNVKKVVYTSFNLAEVVLADPLLTVSMPRNLTADTGVDALVAAIEPFVSVNANFLSDTMAVKAISLIAQNLPIVYAKGDNLAARLHMSLGAIIANLAWQSAGLGAVHALSYILEAVCGIGHARAASIMLPHVMDYNKIGNLPKFALIAEALGERIDGISTYEAAEKSVNCVRRLLEVVGISVRLSDYGVTIKEIPRLVEGAMKQARLFVPNPRNLDAADVEKIYLNALN